MRFIFLSGEVELVCGVARGLSLRVSICLVDKRTQTIIHVWISLFISLAYKTAHILITLRIERPATAKPLFAVSRLNQL